MNAGRACKRKLERAAPWALRANQLLPPPTICRADFLFALAEKLVLGEDFNWIKCDALTVQ